MGSIGEDRVRVVNREVIDGAGASYGELTRVEAAEHTELARRAGRFRAGKPRRTVIVVDDGIATGRADSSEIESRASATEAWRRQGALPVGRC